MPVTSLLTRTSFDSASLASQAAIAHPMPQTGRWRLEAHGPRGSAPWVMDIVVRDGGLPRVAVDLAQPATPTNCCDAGETPLSPGGMLNLNLQSDRGGGFALLYGATGSDPVWDSRRLGPGDTYACMPLRPGTYTVANSLGPAKASVRVTYPDPRAAAAGARLASGPAPIKVGQTMDPGEQTIDPGQVLVFAIETTAQLTLVLKAPDDGPQQAPR